MSGQPPLPNGTKLPPALCLRRQSAEQGGKSWDCRPEVPHRGLLYLHERHVALLCPPDQKISWRHGEPPVLQTTDGLTSYPNSVHP